MLSYLYTFLLLILIFLTLLTVRTLLLELGNDQVLFTAGTTDSLPDGQYVGSVSGPKVSWIGKNFDANNHSGINKFRESDGSVTKKYPFVLSLGPGVHDNKNVIRIDYNIPTNPWWLKPILDEVVQIAPNQYLGKLQLRIVPWYPFTLTYFRLAKE